MKVYLINHIEEYSAEQLMMTLLPDMNPRVCRETPPDSVETDYAVSELCGNAAYARVRIAGRVKRGECQVPDSSIAARRYAVKMSLYRAVVALTGVTPPWGALSGVRPAKLASKYLANGEASCAEALTKLYCLRSDKAALAARCAATARSVFGRVKAAAPEGTEPCIAYAGIPYCPSRCAYCSFVSFAGNDGTEIESYLDSLRREIIQKGEALRAGNYSLAASYIGGGTPTILSAAQLDTLLGAWNDAFGAPFTGEFTVESGRPDTIDAEKLAVMRSHGVTRVCVNPQTLSPKALALAKRGHTVEDFFTAFSLASDAGFDVNVDLIAGLAGETADSFEAGLKRVIELSPANITVHALAKKRAAEISRAEAGSAAFVDRSAILLKNAGYRPYYVYRQKNTSDGAENVGWTRDGKYSVYNILMMEELTSVFSCGSGGVTKLIRDGAFRRETNAKYPREYVEASNGGQQNG